MGAPRKICVVESDACHKSSIILARAGARILQTLAVIGAVKLDEVYKGQHGLGRLTTELQGPLFEAMVETIESGVLD